jgi:hypothetical protein
VLTLREHLRSLPGFWWNLCCSSFYFSVVVALVFVLTIWVPCCDVRYDFRIGTMFGSYLPPVICGCFRIVVSNTYYVVFVFGLSSSRVPNVDSFSGLSIFDCPFGILQRLFQFMLMERVFSYMCLCLKYTSGVTLIQSNVHLYIANPCL